VIESFTYSSSRAATFGIEPALAVVMQTGKDNGDVSRLNYLNRLTARNQTALITA